MFRKAASPKGNIHHNFADETTEKHRYSNMAKLQLNSLAAGNPLESGIDGIAEPHRPPFEQYYKAIKSLIQSQHIVLELAAGTGRHSLPIVATGAEIYALDISEDSLKVLMQRVFGRVIPICADMQNLPFPDDKFDFILSCGGLSYGENNIVLSEIIRTLKPGGSVIFLDSLNHNPVFRFNRYVHYLKGNRTLSTLRRMPTLNFLFRMKSHFLTSELYTYGNYLWLQEVFIRLRLGENSPILRYLERNQNERNAFKFLIICKNLRK